MTDQEIAERGSELEHASAERCAQFARQHRGAEGPVGDLALFASFSATAKCERLAGRIDAAVLAEADADRCYKRLPEGAKW